MPKLPNPFENFPRPPRISQIIKKGNPLREVIQDAREVIESGREAVTDIASAIRVEGKPFIEPTSEEISSSVVAGTACIPCSRDHLSTTSSALSEGIRFAREKGIKDPEVVRRIRIALDELNVMERIDLAPTETAKLRGAEKELANWTLKSSRDLRHAITAIKDVESMEQAAAKASAVTEDFISHLWSIPEDECETCAEVRESIRDFIEKRKRERAGM